MPYIAPDSFLQSVRSSFSSVVEIQCILSISFYAQVTVVWVQVYLDILYSIEYLELTQPATVHIQFNNALRADNCRYISTERRTKQQKKPM